MEEQENGDSQYYRMMQESEGGDIVRQPSSTQERAVGRRGINIEIRNTSLARWIGWKSGSKMCYEGLAGHVHFRRLVAACWSELMVVLNRTTQAKVSGYALRIVE